MAMPVCAPVGIGRVFMGITIEDVDAIWKRLLEAAKLEVYDTLTHGGSTATVIDS